MLRTILNPGVINFNKVDFTAVQRQDNAGSIRWILVVLADNLVVPCELVTYMTKEEALADIRMLYKELEAYRKGELNG